MKENEINIDDYVYVVRKFGDYWKYSDIQIIKYKVQYKGKLKFIPYGFQDMSAKYREILYDICSKTLEEAKQVVYLMVGNSIEFAEQNNGQYYDVKFKEE